MLRIERAEQAVLLVVGTCGEIQRVQVSTAHTVTEAERPQPIDHDLLTIGASHLAHELTGGRIVSVDTAVPEVANPESAAEVACPTDR